MGAIHSEGAMVRPYGSSSLIIACIHETESFQIGVPVELNCYGVFQGSVQIKTR